MDNAKFSTELAGTDHQRPESLARPFHEVRWLFSTMPEQSCVFLLKNHAAIYLQGLIRGTSVLWTSAISSQLSQYIHLFFWELWWTLLCSDDSILKKLPPFLAMFALQSCLPWDLTTSFINQSKLTLLRSRDCTLTFSFLTALRILKFTISWSLQPRLPLITTSSTSPSLLVNSSRSSCGSPP